MGIEPNEGYGFGDGDFGPYIQSERLDIYKPIINKLINDGYAYYAFDTENELNMYKTVKSFKYNCFTRNRLNNSLNMSTDRLNELLSNGTPYVIRAKVPKDKNIILDDVVRGKVKINSNELDDKVLVKSDGIPTYHLAATVDDYLMKITHVLRGDEWLSSAPLHILIHEWIGNTDIPMYAHLSVILRPDGKKKLSKRDGDELGICVFPLKYTDEDDNTIKNGYKELGYLPDALANNLALLGWNPGDNSEVISFDDLISKFDLAKLHKAGARFDKKKFEWLNKQHIMNLSDDDFVMLIFNNVNKLLLLGFDDYKIYNVWNTVNSNTLEILKTFKSYKDLLYIVSLIRTKINNSNDIYTYVQPFLTSLDPIKEDVPVEIINGLKNLHSYLIKLDNITPDVIEAEFKNIIASDDYLMSNKKIFMKAFVKSLTSCDTSASVYHLANYIGKYETCYRLLNYITLNDII